MNSCRFDSETLIENRIFRLPPSGFSPTKTAIASIRMEFPLPLSPTRKVTFGSIFSVGLRIAGREGGVDGVAGPRETHTRTG